MRQSEVGGIRGDVRLRLESASVSAEPVPNRRDSGRSELDAAIRRGAEALIRAQQDDGHWCYPLEADCTIPAEYVTSDVSARCALLLGTVARGPELDRALARCVEFLRGEHEEDGSEGSPERAGEPGGYEDPRSDGNEDSIHGGTTMIAAVRELAIAVESFLEGDRYEIPWSEVILGGGTRRAGESVFTSPSSRSWITDGFFRLAGPW